MKKQILVLFVLMSCFLSSCNDEKIQLSKNYFGTINVFKNGENWQPLIYASQNRKEKEYIVLHIEKPDRQNIIRESLYLHAISKRKGYNLIKSKEEIDDFPYENNIRRYASYYTHIADGDVGCASYQVDDSVEIAGYVNVTTYDESSGRIEGTFEVTLVKERSCEENAPDTLHFTEGFFSTKIQD
ncbi:hypothetical protein ACE193_18465 [Bernardetia sp. OM2101]|uniref:hypothetical protein n=1 Tax=Bernardetia sp. OM2101 TaxID=3344876 RepID=UPI0035D0A125